MASEYDVVIVGGGPAGSLCAAIVLRQNPGRRVLLLEREAFPRHHVGEVTLPGWAAVLRLAGVYEKLDAHVTIKKIGIVFNWGPPEVGDTWTADFRDARRDRPPAGSWHVERATFDAVLLDHAASLGATVRQRATVVAVRAGHGEGAPREGDPVDHVEVTWTEEGTTHRTTAGHIVDATGQARLLTRLWGLPLHRHADMNNVAVYGYWRGSHIHRAVPEPKGNERWAVVSTCDHGWLWHIPISPDVTSVGLVTNSETIRHVGRSDLAALYLDAVRTSPSVQALVEDAMLIGALPDGSAPERLQSISDWAYYSEQCCGPGWFQTGDTAMFVDPILSSGLTLASQGAMMVANALTTLWTDTEVDAPLLRQSLQRRYRQIGDVYHRMARVWYRQNGRASSWHWQALQERLRAGGRDAVYERGPDAFTAICLGAICDPLENALRAGGKESRYASEYFTWLTSRRLFEQDDARWAGADELSAARAAGRRTMRARWARIARSTLRLRAASVRVCEGYHTNPESGGWKRVRYTEVETHAAGDEPLRLVFPVFDDQPDGLLPLLTGDTPTNVALRALLAPFPVGSDERSGRLVTNVEMLVQLDMLELLPATDTPAAPALDNHPLLTVLLDAALRAANGATRAVAELDWLGEQCLLTIEIEGKSLSFRLADATRVDRMRFAQFSTHTAITCLYARSDPWADAFMGSVINALLRCEVDGARLWEACAELPGIEVAARRNGEGALTWELLGS